LLHAKIHDSLKDTLKFTVKIKTIVWFSFFFLVTICLLNI
jgi:hypothetical protein